jgi:RNA polymerase sigma-70 factor (ECF subfamily)
MGSTSASLIGRLGNLNDTAAWREFEARYTPRLMAWCRGNGLQPADAKDVTQEVLLRVVRRMQTFVYDPQSNFSGWLKTVWRNAWIDFVNDHAPGTCGTGDSTVHAQLHDVPGGDLTKELAEEFEREALHEALARVRPQVSARDWKIFQDLIFGGKSGTAVAQEHHLTLPAVGMVKLRVQNKVSEEIAKLEGTGRKEGAGEP